MEMISLHRPMNCIHSGGMNLKSIDLTLLMAFDVLMREKHVSRAAELMFVSQSAISHMLSRLRQLFDDPLFVRTSTGMAPTARAHQLAEPVRKILREIDELVRMPQRFDPKDAKHRFVIAANDYVDYFILPLLMHEVEQHAPGVDLLFAPQDLFNLEAHMETGAIDVALGFEPVLNPGPTLQHISLFQDRMACLVRANHPQVRERVSLKQFLKLSHLLVSSAGHETGIIDEVLSQRGETRRIGLVMTHFLPAVRVVANTDLILSLPLRLARQFTAQAPVKVVPVPLELPSYNLIMMWHPLQDADLACVWLRNEIVSASRTIAQESLD
jgi:DNA-binding transcriptional LysR family regulator